MSEWVRVILDLVLIGMVAAGLVQASRLIGHLTTLRQGRVEMERFVHEFNAAVVRAEAGIKGLRLAARESGDDLEKLVEKGNMVRDELQFIVESADQIAERLSYAATTAVRPDVKPGIPKADVKAASKPQAAAAPQPLGKPEPGPAPASRAEKELLQALQKLT